MAINIYADIDLNGNVITEEDKTAEVSANDTTPGFLVDKVVAGSNITVTETNDGGNETLVISSTASGTDENVSVSANDTTPGNLSSKLVAGANVTLTENNDGGNETLTIASSGSGGGGGALELISVVTAVGGETSLSFSGLSGVDENYVAQVVMKGTTDDYLTIEINGDTTAGNYESFVIFERNTGVNPVYDYQVQNHIGFAYDPEGFCHMDLNIQRAPDDCAHYWGLGMYLDDTNGEPSSIRTSGFRGPNTTEITSLAFGMKTGTITAGSFVKLYRYSTSALGGSDEFVQVSGDDTTAGYLLDKIAAGTNITLTETNPGADEDLTIAASDPSVNVSSNDTTPSDLATKLVAGSNITITEQNDGGNETLEIASTGGGGSSFERKLLVGLSSNINVSNNDEIAFNSVGLDVDSGWSTSRYTIPEAGDYEIIISLRPQVNSTARHEFFVYRERTSVEEAFGSTEFTPSSTSHFPTNISRTTRPYLVGDIIFVRATNVPASLLILGNSAVPYAVSYMEINKVA